jgi:hypothetical protein
MYSSKIFSKIKLNLQRENQNIRCYHNFNSLQNDDKVPRLPENNFMILKLEILSKLCRNDKKRNIFHFGFHL